MKAKENTLHSHYHMKQLCLFLLFYVLQFQTVGTFSAQRTVQNESDHA